MANYSFAETLGFFSEKLNTSPPEEDLERGEVELVIDTLHVILSKGKLEGSLQMRIALGLFLQPIREDRLKELATSNFLGTNTGGCKLSFDKESISLYLHGYMSCGASPQESWEWLHRLLCVAREWNKVLALWEEFIPLSISSTEEKKNEHPTKSTYRA
jgi:hypothetical protein